MSLLLLIVGFVLFALGLGYLFQPELVLKFNMFMRETFFKDSVVLLNNKRLGILLLLLSFIVIVITLQGR
jgi:hypothetical protein